MYKKVELKNPERYSKASETLTKEKLEQAADFVLAKLRRNAEKFGDNMVEPHTGWNQLHTHGHSYNLYVPSNKVTWTTGMWTGFYWLAYQYSGDEFYRKVAESHMKHYLEEIKHPERLDDHDTGFKYLPSCVAAYKVTGEEKYREAAIKAAEIQLAHCCQVNKFIIRVGDGTDKYNFEDYRTLVDSIMNIPLFFWAYEQTGDKKFYDMAVGHYNTTIKYLVREDGSSYHHYQFDPKTKKPLYGATFQGNRDESTWTRGHSWLVYGFPNAYRYTKDEKLLEVHKAVAYYFMDHLPSDGIPFWDFDFTDGSFEPRDSVSNLVSACGLMEACKHLPDSDKDKKLFRNAAEYMLESVMDKTINYDENKDCIVTQVTGSRPHNIGVANCETYGDYFYFEAIVRFLRPEIEFCW